MKKLLFPTFVLACAFSLMADDAVPAFPGAEGHGRYVTGGRGGKVIHVTNLNDSGTGSLRDALSESGSRTIVFDVSGDIHLKSNLTISKGDVSVLGQTAPGGGITICDYTIENKANNVIIRFIRVRRGELAVVNDGADAFWGRNRSNIILDHLSLSWSTDEVASWYDNKNFTMQWCVCAEGLASGHSKGSHSYGGIWGGKDASFHHNMIAHVNNRVPRINGARYEWDGYDKTKYPNVVEAERLDLRNNVYYNWGNGNGCYGGPGGGYVNIVNNYYKVGPATTNKTRVLQASVADSGNSKDHDNMFGYASRYYINGNYVTAASKKSNYDWSGVIYDSGHLNRSGVYYTKDPKNFYVADDADVYVSSGVRYVKVKLSEPVDAGTVTTHSAEEAFNKMLAYGGASLMRDGHDVRYMEEARTGTTTYKGSLNGWNGILDKSVDVIPDYTGSNPYPWSTPEAVSRPAGFDTDGDGIPDEWEKANGLDSNKNDANLYTLDPKGWYTNIEVYANSLVEHIMKSGNADALDAVDEYYPVLPQSGFETVVMSSEVERIEYYNLSGVRVEEPVTGVNIRRIVYVDGRVETDKVIKR